MSLYHMSASFKLIVISAEASFEHEVQLISQLFASGLQYFHLRKPNWTKDEMSNFLNALPVTYHNRIVLHSNFDLTEKFKIKGIHLNEENRKNISAFYNKKIISTSFHSLEDIENNKYPFEYVFLSPVFNSISKSGYTGKFDLRKVEECFKSWKQQKRTMPEVIALGGVEAINISTVKRLGFDGAAVLGSIWGSTSPVNSLAEFQSIV